MHGLVKVWLVDCKIYCLEVAFLVLSNLWLYCVVVKFAVMLCAGDKMDGQKSHLVSNHIYVAESFNPPDHCHTTTSFAGGTKAPRSRRLS